MACGIGLVQSLVQLLPHPTLPLDHCMSLRVSPLSCMASNTNFTIMVEYGASEISLFLFLSVLDFA